MCFEVSFIQVEYPTNTGVLYTWQHMDTPCILVSSSQTPRVQCILKTLLFGLIKNECANRPGRAAGHAAGDSGEHG